MKQHRIRRERVESVLDGVGLRLLGTCVVLLAFAACKKPTAETSDEADAGRRDSRPTSGTEKKDAQTSGSADSGPSPACKTGGSPSKGKGEVCSCDDECRTGHCANGVCCTSTCTDKCKACNLPNTLGNCDFIPAGVPPIDASQCKASNPGSCGQDGTCDGKGGCQLYLAETVCSYGKCDGDGLSGVKVCDGKGNCAGDMSRPCAPYSCNPATNECYSACSANAQCALGQECASNSCGVKLNGYKCAKDDECASGHCADGYCCNVSCNGPCVSCALTGSFGRCRLVPAGHHDASCEERAGSTCGTTGICDGLGGCALWPADTTPCKSATCSSAVLLSTTAVCDGKGICKEPTLVDCSPYLCASGQCNRSCKNDDDCEPGHACLPGEGEKPGTCSGKKRPGQPCDKADDCDSGNCVDGVCCESKCEGACRSCALPGSPGRCTSLPSGARDPRQVCVDEGSASCGRNGLCDGGGGCQLYPAGTTSCGSPSCDSFNIFTDAPACNQAGQCVAPPSRGCDPYVCNGNTCLASCTKDSDCVPPNTCKNNSCGKKPNGADCSSDIDCRSGFCAQGVCCNSRCDGACNACNLAGNPGMCIAVADGSPDPQEKCPQTASSSCGTSGACKGGACAFFDTSTPCKPSSCATSASLHPSSNCDGKGACVTPADQSCGSYICANNACLVACKTDPDCVPPNTCVNNSCGRKPNGAACTNGDQCNSGFCTEGVCCNSACADGTTNSLCMSCKVSGRVGACSVVPDGQADPKQRCAASDPASGNCSNDGTCNGRGGCRPWSTSIGCRAASCTGSTYTPAAHCDGAGNCPISMQSKCDPYKCGSSNSCLTTCTSDADCITGETCLTAEHRCGEKLANGQACGAHSDCSSGICSGEGVCCDVTCSQACKSCTLPSHLGTCTDISNGGSPRDETTCAKGDACGNTGNCNGAGGCQLEAAETLCGVAADTCAAAISGRSVDGSEVTQSVARIPAPRCDGLGSCRTPESVSCGPYQCEGGKCKEGCSSTNTDCNSLIPSASNDKGGNSCVVEAGSHICKKLPNGSACSVKEACSDGNCVDGTCCEKNSCDDGQACTADSCANSDGKCSHTIITDTCLIADACYPAGTVNPDHTCQICAPAQSRTSWSPRSAGTVCRSTAGECDVEEKCGESSIDCPADSLVERGVSCRAKAGDCDVEEKCDGTHAACPSDQVEGTSTVCRAANGLCDAAEMCDGVNVGCPLDVYRTDPNTPCQAADPDRKCQGPTYCDGRRRDCPVTVLAKGTECRGANGVCDVAEVCDGESVNCPGDGYLTDLTTPCQAANPDHKCQGPTYCDGRRRDCPVTVLAKDTECRGADGVCDVAEVCDGESVNCPGDGYLTDLTKPCKDADPNRKCQGPTYCDGRRRDCPVTVLAKDTECRGANGVCDVAEVCDGISDECPTNAFQPATFLCDAADDKCTQYDAYCTGSGADCPVNLPKTCPTADVCYPATCDENTGACGTKYKCGADEDCTSDGTCIPKPPVP